jgi:HD-GYP domain-containing protein (c-di-GMP phosphodiesterase class II)
MGICPAELLHVRRGSQLHDIGKMGIPDSILLKPGPLTDAEWIIMRQHPTYAYELLSPIDYLRQALDIPHYHHEKWNGSRYPYHLLHERIPLTARIFSIVDVWDALRSDRPYRAGWPDENVLAYLLAESGRHFDRDVVAAFMSLDLAGVKLAEA